MKLCVVVGALAWALSGLALPDLLAAAGRLSATALAASTALLSLNLLVGAVRWRELMRAWGVEARLPLSALVHGYLVAAFYNTFVPGAVGGDVLRAHATRHLFEAKGDAYTTVLIERGVGLSALLFLSGVGLGVTSSLPRGLAVVMLLASVVSTAATVALPGLIAAASSRIPERLREKLPRLSAPKRLGPFVPVIFWSIASQLVGTLSVFVLVLALVPRQTAMESVGLVPLAMLSLYSPVPLAGLGVREATFVVLFGYAGIGAADATATSLAYMGVILTLAALGGVAHLVRPLALGEAKGEGRA